jgi:hypothetical protein
MKTEDICYALAKQVPDMDRGFQIHTNYGDITIPPGRIADRLTLALRQAFQAELLAAVKRAERAKGANCGI